jgi:hypothetical protein
MRHSQYRWVDYAEGSASRRNNVVLTSSVKAASAGKTDCYATVFRFGDDFPAYVQNNKGSVGGYGGRCVADYVPIDIDREGNLMAALAATRKLVFTLMEYYDVDPRQPRYRFSGSKGFHVLLPVELLGGVEPSEHLPAAFALLAERVAEAAGDEGPKGEIIPLEIDHDMYQRLRLFRLTNTRNSKGLWCVELSWDELSTLPPDRIRDLAREPRPFRWEPPYLEQNDVLAAHSAECLEQAKAPPTTPTGAPALQDRIPHGTRNKTLTSLAGTLRRRGLQEDEILACLSIINENRCLPPLEQKKLARIAASIVRYPSAGPLVRKVAA